MDSSCEVTGEKGEGLMEDIKANPMKGKED
jgi:hypothetical protein